MQNKQINHFTDLDAWKINHQAVIQIYKITKKFPKEEVFGLISQTRRSGVSMAANISEAFGRFRPKDKIHFYHQARGSNTETKNHLIIAKDLGYISELELNKIQQLLISGRRLINGLIRSTQKLHQL